MVGAPVATALLAFTLCLVSPAAAQNDREGEHEVTTEIVYSNEASPAGRHPSVIHYKIIMNGSFHVLNLRRRTIGLSRIKVLLPGGQENISKAAFPYGSDDDVAHYHDIQNMAAVSLKIQQGKNHHDMEGTFERNGSLFSIRPKRFGRGIGSRGTHVILNLDSKHAGLIDNVHYPPNYLYKKAASQRVVSPDYQKNSRRRRATKPSYEIDLCYVTDSSFYNTTFNYLRLANPLTSVTDVVREIRYYLSNVENLVALRYSAINIINWSITTNLAALYIETSPTGSAWLDVNATADGPTSRKVLSGVGALNLFGTWVANQPTFAFPKFDHYALFTGYNIYGYDSVGARAYSVVGIAWVGAACTPYSLSIIEFMNDLTEGSVQAHELGHSLNAQHDGIPNSTCNASSNYIMSPWVAPSSAVNFYTFSPCTISYFISFISSLISNLNNCFTNILPTYNATAWNAALSVPPGQHYTAQDQCQRIFGVGFIPCGGTTYGSQMCTALWCYNSSNPSLICYNSGTNVRPLDGTSCGNMKWCYRGQCLSNTSAPPGSDTCPLGDLSSQYPVFSNLNYTCPNLPRSYCYQAANTCCATCAKYYNASWPACPYGDSQTNCASLVPGICSTSPSTCCASCATLTG